MKNMSIGKRLLITFIAVALIASVSGIAGLVVTRSIDSKYSQALLENGFSQGDIGRFNTYFNKASALVRDVIFLSDQEEIESARQELAAAQEKTVQALEDLRGKCRTPQELEQIAIIDEKLPQYQKVREQVVELGMANHNDEALELFRGTARPLLTACQTAAERLMEINVTMGNEVSESLTDQSIAFMLLILLVIVGAIVLSIFMGVSTSRAISRPLQEIERAAKEMAEGSLHAKVEYQSDNELGSLADSMRVLCGGIQKIILDVEYLLGEMADGNFCVKTKAEETYIGDYAPILASLRHINSSLSNTLSQINQSADQVASGSDQVSSGAQALSQGATEQASAVEELAATVNEISKQVKDTAENAKHASDIAVDTGGQLEQSNRRMQDMIQAMQEISSSSNEIGKIIKTIEDIAFQTNILALNAAVEAARAGAAGKGFAVVADEVRNLASKSAEASNNTASLIEHSIRSVENGTKIADETAKALLLSVGGAKEVTDRIEKISQASNEQASSIAQVTTGIDQISSVVQTNSATAEESAAASEELSSQSQMLKNLVGRFTLKTDASASVGMEKAAYSARAVKSVNIAKSSEKRSGDFGEPQIYSAADLEKY